VRILFQCRSLFKFELERGEMENIIVIKFEETIRSCYNTWTNGKCHCHKQKFECRLDRPTIYNT
jgi:hypothetical protein